MPPFPPVARAQQTRPSLSFPFLSAQKGPGELRMHARCAGLRRDRYWKSLGIVSVQVFSLTSCPFSVSLRV